MLNPPVYRIIFFGPRDQGLELARRLYPVCKERRRVPSFHLEETLSKHAMGRLYAPLCSTGAIVYGPHADVVRAALRREHSWVKVLRLLPPGAPLPPPFFSYQEQSFPYPEQEEDFADIANWMGLNANRGEPDVDDTGRRGGLPMEALRDGAAPTDTEPVRTITSRRSP